MLCCYWYLFYTQVFVKSNKLNQALPLVISFLPSYYFINMCHFFCEKKHFELNFIVLTLPLISFIQLWQTFFWVTTNVFFFFFFLFSLSLSLSIHPSILSFVSSYVRLLALIVVAGCTEFWSVGRSVGLSTNQSLSLSASHWTIFSSVTQSCFLTSHHNCCYALLSSLLPSPLLSSHHLPSFMPSSLLCSPHLTCLCESLSCHVITDNEYLWSIEYKKEKSSGWGNNVAKRTHEKKMKSIRLWEESK